MPPGQLGTHRLRHVCIDRPLYTSGWSLTTSLSFSCFKHSWHRFHRLPLTPLSRESCLCTWRLTCLQSDVRIFLHLCTASELNLSPAQEDVNDSIKELALFSAPLHLWHLSLGRLPLNKRLELGGTASSARLARPHSSVCELPRVSVPFGPLALVFAPIR